MKKTDHVFRRKTHGFAVETNGLCAVIVIQCNGSTQTPVLRVISTRKNCPQFKPSVPKHNSVSPAQTCRRRGCANRDRRTTSARHVSTACAATRVLRRGLRLWGQPYPHQAVHVTRGSLTLAGHKNHDGRLKDHAPRLLRGWAVAPVRIQYSTLLSGDAMHVFGARGAPERQEGARAAAPAHAALGLRPMRAITTLREGLQASTSCSGRPQPGHGSLTSQPSSRHPSLENLTILQCSTAFSRNSTHVATMREGAALLPYLISKSCYVLDAEVNPLLLPWTCGSQKAAVADLWISINIHHLQGNRA